MRRFHAALVLVVLLSVAADHKCWAQYTLTDLGTLPGYSGSQAYGVNISGQVVGDVTPNGGFTDPFLYSYGKMSALTGLTAGSAVGINASDQVVGDDASGNPYLYNNGTITVLQINGSPINGVACGINDTGQVVGNFSTFSNDNNYPSRAFLYSNAKVTDLGTLGGNNACAHAINASGQVVGFAWTSGALSHAFLYSGGKMIDLGTLGGSYSCAYAVNSGGEVVGDSYTINLADHAFLYSSGKMTDLGTLPGGLDSYAYGINSSGQVVGWSNTSSAYQEAFIYRNGMMTDLNSLIPSGSGWALQEATAINDVGQIVGYGTKASGETDAFLLTPLKPGDANGDGRVDINDLTIVLSNFGKIGMTWSQGAMDGDPTGKVDINDLTIVLASFGATTAAGIRAVPEPSTVALLLAGAASALAYARRPRPWQRGSPMRTLEQDRVRLLLDLASAKRKDDILIDAADRPRPNQLSSRETPRSLIRKAKRRLSRR